MAASLRATFARIQLCSHLATLASFVRAERPEPLTESYPSARLAVTSTGMTTSPRFGGAFSHHRTPRSFACARRWRWAGAGDTPLPQQHRGQYRHEAEI